jgi:hypothetical protein
MSRRTVFTAFIVASGVAALSAPAGAQDGFALKFGAAFNSSTVESLETDLRFSDAAGWTLGAEYVLPLGFGIGVSGYTAGSPRAFEVAESSMVFIADANYFLRIPGLPLAPYAGAHVGLGRYRFDEVDDARPEVEFGDLGYQVGIRLQAARSLGIDAQFRSISRSAGAEQEPAFERKQFLLSATLF